MRFTARNSASYRGHPTDRFCQLSFRVLKPYLQGIHIEAEGPENPVEILFLNPEKINEQTREQTYEKT